MVKLDPAQAESLVTRALRACGASGPSAASTARALVAAEVDGQGGHGLSRVPSYAAQLKKGKVRGDAVPTVSRSRSGSLWINAHGGFAYPALDLAVAELPGICAGTGVAAAGIHASHHIGQAGLTVERLAERGLIALIVSNTPRAMPFPGGSKAMMGTNPLAFAAPIPGRAPLLVDLALSLVARSKIVAAQKAGRKIPADWAIDAHGTATDDPAAALAGALQPVGGAKGAALALMVEVLCAALVGARYGWEASSFLDDRGDSPGVGQMLIALDPGAFAGPGYGPRMLDLVGAVGAEAGVRLPGDRRLASRERVRAEGLAIAPDLHHQIEELAAELERK